MYTFLATTHAVTYTAENIHSGRHTALRLSLLCILLFCICIQNDTQKQKSAGLVVSCTELEHGDLFIVHTLTSGGVVHVKVDLHLDSVHGRRGHIQ